MPPETTELPAVGFAPVCRADARLLILGSLPSVRSLQVGEYYAHPRNAFWKIMGELVGADGAYERRCQALVERGIALWDVLAESLRPGSLDADIRIESAQPNDFESFFLMHPDVRKICFNGNKAAQLFRRCVDPGALEMRRQFETLPSTSPAYAAMPYADKLARWRRALDDNHRRQS